MDCFTSLIKIQFNSSVGVMVTRLPPKEKTAGSSPVRNGFKFFFDAVSAASEVSELVTEITSEES